MRKLTFPQVKRKLEHIASDHPFEQRPCCILAWKIVEGIEEGEREVEVDYMETETDCIANCSTTTICEETLKEHGLDIDQIQPRTFVSDDRDELVNKMYRELNKELKDD